MAPGKTHELITLLASPAVSATAWVTTQDANIAVIAAGGCLLGVVLSPDLDLLQMTRSRRVATRVPVLGHIFVVLSLIYAAIINTGKWPFVHRGISHWIVIGTITRWLWFIVMPIAVLAFLVGNIEAFDWPEFARIAAPAFVGNVIADVLHLIADSIKIGEKQDRHN